MRFPSINPSSNKTMQTHGFWRSRYAFGVAVIGAVAGYYLLTEHLTHTLGALPYLLLAACPLMHLFMHHTHDAQHPVPLASKEGSVDANPSDQGTPCTTHPKQG